MLVKLTLSVINFINILQAAFALIFFRKNYKTKLQVEKIFAKHLDT